uniref:ATP synthase complex subunit 8 n=1 Tax=Nabis apicalis TaxID=452402 RepID=K7NBG8_9HEMI|nr:ATP synthase F0 subunit 8 [Nabis apicalis]AEI53332.1 ATP synthase F0 subunit 8 [Nabis apicalis]
MPQMAPTWWTMMLMIIIMMLLIVVIINYFNVKYNSTNKKNIKIDLNYTNWKW